jgi:hypothetical protein
VSSPTLKSTVPSTIDTCILSQDLSDEGQCGLKTSDATHLFVVLIRQGQVRMTVDVGSVGGIAQALSFKCPGLADPASEGSASLTDERWGFSAQRVVRFDLTIAGRLVPITKRTPAAVCGHAPNGSDLRWVLIIECSHAIRALHQASHRLAK